MCPLLNINQYLEACLTGSPEDPSGPAGPASPC